jgi:hypothetical protein
VTRLIWLLSWYNTPKGTAICTPNVCDQNVKNCLIYGMVTVQYGDEEYHIPEDDTLQNHRCENLKSYTVWWWLHKAVNSLREWVERFKKNGGLVLMRRILGTLMELEINILKWKERCRNIVRSDRKHCMSIESLFSLFHRSFSSLLLGFEILLSTLFTYTLNIPTVLPVTSTEYPL